MTDKFYITTAIPYVNAPPHIGHALEFVQADTIARIHRLLGNETALLSGSDENALKNVAAAEKAHIPIQKFIDTNAQLFSDLAKSLNVQFDFFQKGSNQEKHFLSCQKLWRLCHENGDIYKKQYEGLYCLGCEMFYTKDELNDHGECFEHPGKKLETVKEENYFFTLSKYQKQIIDLLTRDVVKIVPEFRKNEMLSFLKQPLQDISISRSNTRAKNWGVPVPDDPAQRMYVWFDALNIYQSGVGFGWNEELYKTWWPADVHVIGKGITRFHAIYWIAFLLSAQLQLPKTIFVHGYFTVNGQKMSKTIGNVVDPFSLIKKFGADAVRYYFLREIPPFSDGDFSEKRFIELYNADLANGLGNLVSRVAKLANNYTCTPYDKQFSNLYIGTFKLLCQEFRFNEALAYIWSEIKKIDTFINDTKPWTLKGNELDGVLTRAISEIQTVATMLLPFMPDSALKILNQFGGSVVRSLPPLFPRMSF